MTSTRNQTAQYMEPDIAEFNYEHLPEDLQVVSKKFHELALFMMSALTPSVQRTQGLWDLLRAKDCAVRAAKNARQSV